MPHPVNGVVAASAAVIVAVAAIPPLAQTVPVCSRQGGIRDWRVDRPGTGRLIRPQDLPAPDMAESVRNVVQVVRRTSDQKPIVPNGC